VFGRLILCLVPRLSPWRIRLRGSTVDSSCITVGVSISSEPSVFPHVVVPSMTCLMRLFLEGNAFLVHTLVPFSSKWLLRSWYLPPVPFFIHPDGLRAFPVCSLPSLTSPYQVARCGSQAPPPANSPRPTFPSDLFRPQTAFSS